MKGFEESDFVAQVKIKKITRDKLTKEYLNLDVDVIHLFKGKFNNDLKILTNESMCNVYATPGSEWLVFASRDKNQKLSFHYCSGSLQLDRKFTSKDAQLAQANYQKSITRKLGLLTFLKETTKGLDSDATINIGIPGECLAPLEGMEGKSGEFTVFEVFINKNLSIEKGKQLKKFSNPKLNQALVKC